MQLLCASGRSRLHSGLPSQNEHFFILVDETILNLRLVTDRTTRKETICISDVFGAFKVL